MCEWFEWLFDLAENKSSMVPEMFVYGWDAGGGGVGVAETVVGGGDVREVSDFTSSFYCAG
jgi:hypothetical protein